MHMQTMKNNTMDGQKKGEGGWGSKKHWCTSGNKQSMMNGGVIYTIIP